MKHMARSDCDRQAETLDRAKGSKASGGCRCCLIAYGEKPVASRPDLYWYQPGGGDLWDMPCDEAQKRWREGRWLVQGFGEGWNRIEVWEAHD